MGQSNDRHHAYVNKHYKESPWWWFVIILVVSFVLGLIVVLKEDITLSAWAYVVALLLGCFIAPLVSLSFFSIAGKKSMTTRPTNDDVQSTILYSRFGNGIATNNLSKMLAGLLVPGRPVGNMYFAVSFTTYMYLSTVYRRSPRLPLLLGMVPQRDQQHSQLVERLENGRLS